MEQQQSLWYEFVCPECARLWESQQAVPDREWCACGTATTPELFDQ